jgi:hypothetical protein
MQPSRVTFSYSIACVSGSCRLLFICAAICCGIPQKMAADNRAADGKENVTYWGWHLEAETCRGNLISTKNCLQHLWAFFGYLSRNKTLMFVNCLLIFTGVFILCYKSLGLPSPIILVFLFIILTSSSFNLQIKLQNITKSVDIQIPLSPQIMLQQRLTL